MKEIKINLSKNIKCLNKYSYYYFYSVASFDQIHQSKLTQNIKKRM